jgi:copper chaperone NosL
MITGDVRYAAGVRQATAAYRYDDIGCLVRHSGEALAAGQASGYVHDAGTHDWLPAETAVFVQSHAIRTPMGYGIAAYASAKAARRAAPGTLVLTFNALVASMSREPS